MGLYHLREKTMPYDGDRPRQSKTNRRLPNGSRKSKADLQKTRGSSDITRHYLHAVLQQWSNQILDELDNNNFNSKTTIYRMMEYGCMFHTPAIPIPSYWPDKTIRKLNDLIFELDIRYRNIIIGIWLLKITNKTELARLLSCDRSTVYNWISDAEDILSKSL